MTAPPAVLWEDPHGLAVAKPAGMLTQGPAGSGPTVEAWVRDHLRPGDPASVYLGTVHRLDRPVSGVILWAKTPRAARRWAEQFARREARKEYWAIVEGDAAGLPGEPGSWDDWIGRPDAAGRAPIAREEAPGLVRATTRFEVGRGRPVPEGFAWLRLRPETGRTHQLRAQAASRGVPIVGDATYGAVTPFGEGIALHARSLSVVHPSSLARIEFEAPLPPTWSGWLSAERPIGPVSRSRSR